MGVCVFVFAECNTEVSPRCAFVPLCLWRALNFTRGSYGHMDIETDAKKIRENKIESRQDIEQMGQHAKKTPATCWPKRKRKIPTLISVKLKLTHEKKSDCREIVPRHVTGFILDRPFSWKFLPSVANTNALTQTLTHTHTNTHTRVHTQASTQKHTRTNIWRKIKTFVSWQKAPLRTNLHFPRENFRRKNGRVCPLNMQFSASNYNTDNSSWIKWFTSFSKNALCID